MKKKLPVTTISLHPRKKNGLFWGMVLSVLFSVLYLYIFVNLESMSGKVLTIILFLTSIGAIVFNIIALLVLKK